VDWIQNYKIRSFPAILALVACHGLQNCTSFRTASQIDRQPVRMTRGWDREREFYFTKSHISLWEYSSDFRLIGRGVPIVSVVSQLVYNFSVWPPPGKISRSPHERMGTGGREREGG